MGYIENNLKHNEQVVAKAKFSWLATLPSLLALVVVVFVLPMVIIGSVEQLQGMGIIEVLAYFLAYGGSMLFIILAWPVVSIVILVKAIITILTVKTAVLVATDKRIMGKFGIIARNTLDMPLSKVDNISIEQTFWGRILGFSTIKVSSTSSSWSYKLIARAHDFKNLVIESIEQAKQNERIEEANLMAEAIRIGHVEQASLVAEAMRSQGKK